VAEALALHGKASLVTGARLAENGTSIGSAVAMALAIAGSAVALIDVDGPGAEALAARIRESGAPAVAFAADMSDEAAVDKAVAAVAARFGAIDVLVNNVGMVVKGDDDLLSADAGVWRRTFATNTISALLGCRSVLPHMLARKGGVIVNIGSAQGETGDVSHPAYGASKAAVSILSRYVAAQFGKNGIRCNTVAPGLTLTGAAEHMVPGALKELHLRHTLARRLAVPGDVAAAVVFLASDTAEMINGQTLVIDGGMNSHRALTADYSTLRPAQRWPGSERKPR
jgi:NAD(P)-dependent dehydrogenase (short-subunit alcohol dehydrogenase family)